MKILVIICRLMLGIPFVIFGLNIIHPFMPAPPPQPGSLTAQFMAVMMPTHWMLLVGAVQALGGALVASGRYTPLGLTFLGPVLVNILAFHLCLEGGKGIAPGLVFSFLEAFLIFSYWQYFRPMVTGRLPSAETLP